MPWDLFCRVVDNFGDIGVCWRFAADLAGRGQPVRLWVDDARALAWMAPDRAVRHPGVEVLPWQQAAMAPPEPGAVVVEAFGCDPPPAFIARMAAKARPPVWINLEYLSAEAEVERNHGLPSPQLSGPAKGLTKHFFYPGFTPATGGLIREPGLLTRQAAFDGAAWLAGRGWAARAGERVTSLFCYPQARVAEWIERLADRPTLLLATSGAASEAVRATLGPGLQRGALRAVCLPWLDQQDYDHLLWSCDLNAVRGEDSLVRAMWAGRPFLWQIYPQHDGVHRIKLDALLGRLLDDPRHPVSPSLADGLRRWWHAWNADADEAASPLPAELPDLADWTRLCLGWRGALAGQADMVSQLQGFVEEAG